MAKSGQGEAELLKVCSGVKILCFLGIITLTCHLDNTVLQLVLHRLFALRVSITHSDQARQPEVLTNENWIFHAAAAAAAAGQPPLRHLARYWLVMIVTAGALYHER